MMRITPVTVVLTLTVFVLGLTGCSSSQDTASTECAAAGAIGVHYTEIAGPEGPLGSCTGAEHDLDGGRMQEFAHGAVYWTESTGAWEVYGAIAEKYATDGGPGSAVGWPISGELVTANGAGQFNRFEHGNIYHSPAGTHSVHGAIFDEWGRQGFEQGQFGFPTTDEFAVTDGVQTNFQGGWIRFITATGETVTS